MNRKFWQDFMQSLLCSDMRPGYDPYNNVGLDVVDHFVKSAEPA